VSDDDSKTPIHDNVIAFRARETTIYAVTVCHEDYGRRVIITEEAGAAGPRTVADFICEEIDEEGWLERFGKRPWHAYRDQTIDNDPDGPTITIHVPGAITFHSREKP